jgi:hypothetical protein
MVVDLAKFVSCGLFTYKYKMIPNEKVSLVYIGDWEVQSQIVDPS